MKLQAVSNRKLYLQIADQIRDQITAGALESGRQLPSERELAASLGVSRPTVREALIALEVAGLVEVRVGVGAFVRGPQRSGDSLPEQGHSPLEIMSVRRMIEPEAAAYAAQEISPEGAARLAEILRHMQADVALGTWSSEHDRNLHMTIAEGSGNSMLREVMDMLWSSRSEEVDARFHEHLAAIGDIRAHILDDHSHIVSAVMKGDGEAARQAMAAHLDFVAAAMLNSWE